MLFTLALLCELVKTELVTGFILIDLWENEPLVNNCYLIMQVIYTE